jgi:hypothetical protein
MSTIELTSKTFKAEPRRHKRLSKINNKMKLTQDWEGFDDFEDTVAMAEEEEEDEDFDGEAMFSRSEPFTEDEMRAIDQQGFLFPDYCVCLRPNDI